MLRDTKNDPPLETLPHSFSSLERHAPQHTPHTPPLKTPTAPHLSLPTSLAQKNRPPHSPKTPHYCGIHPKTAHFKGFLGTCMG